MRRDAAAPPDQRAGITGDDIGGIGADDERGYARARVSLRGRDEQLERVAVDDGVGIEHQDRVAAVRLAPPDTGVDAAGKAEVCHAPDERGFRKPRRDQIGRAVHRRVVHDDDAVRRPALRPQRLQAFADVLRAVVVHDDDADAHRPHLNLVCNSESARRHSPDQLDRCRSARERLS
jgi:hypothetical protein